MRHHTRLRRGIFRGALPGHIGIFTARGAGIGLGLTALNLLANMSERVRLLKCLTPFAYCEAADIAISGVPDPELLAIGLAVTAAGIAAAYGRYCTKDMR